MCQVLPVGVAYVWDVIPLAHRLATCWWSNSAVPLHILQVVPRFKCTNHKNSVDFALMFICCCLLCPQGGAICTVCILLLSCPGVFLPWSL